MQISALVIRHEQAHSLSRIGVNGRFLTLNFRQTSLQRGLFLSEADDFLRGCFRLTETTTQKYRNR